MIEAVAPTERVRRAYDLYSHFYGWLVAPLERRPRLLGLERVHIQPEDRVLEVAVGPGSTLVEILRRVKRTTVVQGVDLSPKMLERARRLVAKTGHTNVRLTEADARELPFESASFDVLLNSYMLDLIPLEDMPVVLGEFRRVLRPGGRLVLVNMSKRDCNSRTSLERLYTALPPRVVPYLLGSYRPVLMEGPVREAGFVDVRRDFVRQFISSEVISARAPARAAAAEMSHAA